MEGTAAVQVFMGKLALDSETLIGISTGEMRQPNELYKVVWNEKKINFYWAQSQHQFQISCSPLNSLTTVKPLDVIRWHSVTLNVKSGYHKIWHNKITFKIFLCFSFLVYLKISECRESLNVKTKGDKFISLCVSRHKWKPIYKGQKIESENNKHPYIKTLNSKMLQNLNLCDCPHDVIKESSIPWNHFFMLKRYIKIPSCHDFCA